MEKKDKTHICSVVQCKIYRSENISLHKIPQNVMKNKILKKKWMHILKMGKEFSKAFRICSAHFEKKYLLSRLNRGSIRKRVGLSNQAIPTLNLPVSTIKKKKLIPRRVLFREESVHSDTPIKDFTENFDEDVEKVSKAVQCSYEVKDKGTDIQKNFCKEFFITSLWDTKAKLRIMTGIPSFAILDEIVNICEEVLPDDSNRLWSMRDRVLLTMHKLKANLNFSALAVNFKSSFFAVKQVFIETIQLLAQILGDLIHWQSREKNSRNLPKCFEKFSNVRAILDCTEVKVASFGCLSCRTSTYSHYKSQHTIKVLIGVAPSGLLNYISPSVAVRASDKAVFNLTSLIEKFQPGDAVMVDKGFMISNELSQAGIDMIKPNFAYNMLTKSEVNHNTNIASARVHVERRIGRMKDFKILAEKVPTSILPYIDDVLKVIGAMTNLGNPLLADDKVL